MIGQSAVTKSTVDVIVVVGKNPSWFDGKDQGEIPMIYTQKSRPKPNDLAILKGKQVQLIHGETTDEMFFAWFKELINTKPKFMVALDSQGEIVSC